MLDHNNKKDFSMPWMIILCVLPIVILLLVGRKLFSAGYLWPILIGALVMAHFWLMFRGRGSGHGEQSDKAEGREIKAADSPHNEHKKGGGCCH